MPGPATQFPELPKGIGFESIHLALFDGDGNIRAKLEAIEEGPGLFLTNDAGKARGLGIDKHGPRLLLTNAAGRVKGPDDFRCSRQCFCPSRPTFA